MSALRRWWLWGVAAVVIVASLAIGASRPAPSSLEARTEALASQVRCPVCQGESAAQSQTPAAVAIRTQISSELAAGLPAQAVLDDIERSYGASILEKPPTSGVSLLVWVLPAVIAIAGTAVLGAAFVRWRRAVRQPLAASSAPAPAP